MAVEPRPTLKRPARAARSDREAGATEPSIVHPRAHLIREGASTFDEIFAPTSFFAVEGILARNEAISPSEIAAAIEANPDQPLPPLIRNRVCLLLRGKYKGKPGPKGSI